MLLFANNAVSILVGALNTAATTFSIATADANLFPQPSAGDDHFMLTIEDLTQTPALREIVRCTSRTGVVMTVLRAQEGTTATAFSAGATVSNRITAGSLGELAASAGAQTQLYLGAFATAPTTTNSGGVLVAGLLYFNTTSGQMFEYSGVAWEPLAGGSGTTSAGDYLGAFANPPAARPDNSALQPGDLYYRTSDPIGLNEYLDGAWGPAQASTSVTGSTTVGGNLTVEGDLTVIGSTTLDDGLTVTGGIDSDNGTFTDLTVTDTFTLGIGSTTGSFIFNGKPVVTAGDLSGGSNSQNWPNGNIEYWGEAATPSNGVCPITFPVPFPNACTGVQASIKGPAGAGPTAIVIEDASSTGFTLCSFGISNQAPYGPVAFYWTAKGN